MEILLLGEERKELQHGISWRQRQAGGGNEEEGAITGKRIMRRK